MSFFDLQLFNEVEQPVTDSSTQEAQEQENSQQENDQNYEFAIDDNGQIVFRQRTPEEPAKAQEEQPKPYTPEEIAQEPIERLDPSRIPPELQPYYKSMLADYTRKTQALAEQRRQFEMQMAQFQQAQQPPQQQQQAQQPTEPPVNVQRQYYEQLHGIAKARVEQAFGEAFDELNPMHATALVDEVANVKVYLIEQQQRQAAIQNVLGSFQQDPEWQSIDKYAMELLDNMPYHQAKQIRSRIESGDIAFMNDFLKHAKTEYYKAKNPAPAQQSAAPSMKLKPPAVESAGQGLTKNEQPTFDPKSLGRMSVDDQAKVFERLGLIDL